MTGCCKTLTSQTMRKGDFQVDAKGSTAMVERAIQSRS